VEIETARLRLRPLTADDEADLLRLGTDPEVMRFLNQGRPLTPEENRERLGVVLEHWRKHGFGIWAVIERGSGAFVGRCGLRHTEDLPDVELAYGIHKAYWGRGLMTEAAAASLACGFERLGFERIVAMALPENVASWRVMEKVGMVFQKRAPHKGLEHVWYAATRADYLRRKGGHG
jgi:RimJ/RimL family protein N-acetyltransferase